MLQAASRFNKLLQHFPRAEFASLVKKHLAERAAKSFTYWTPPMCGTEGRTRLETSPGGAGCC